MSNDNFPKPPGHKTFQFQPITISSDFDSGNCGNVVKIGNNQFHLWIATDHPKNNYRTWFHFSVSGVAKATTLSFTIKNMQNQSRLLNEGLVPVYREEGSEQWRRISEKVNTASIEYNEGWIQWTFKHYFKSTTKHYFAFFYPWSNQENSDFLTKIQEKSKQNPDIYCYRSSISKSLEGRNIQFLVISSNKNKSNKEEQINDQNLFKNQKRPLAFSEKQGIVISARVHPGEVPGSHVMTGIIKTLVQLDGPGKYLRDQFVFYIFPILNPDGVARGHYRVDTNGINLNRCYLNPSPKEQPSIYAIRKIICHLHQQNKFFAYLDLHAHASRKGTFIYGNCSNQLMKQVKACIFPKLLSMNSIDFEYEGSNFTQKNMYSKDRGDHISKQGSGRVAMYKLTKNAYCWTMQCNYNISRINNILQPKKSLQQPLNGKQQIDMNNIDNKIVVEYKQQQQIEAKQYFTIATYHKLGRQICQTFLDLVEKNPQSRIDNVNNYYKSVVNVKLNLAVALMRMAPNRFETAYKKIYSGIANSENPQIIKNSLKSLYYLMIKNAKITNINNYIKTGDQKQIQLPQVKNKKQQKNNTKTMNFRSRQTRYNSNYNYNSNNNSNNINVNINIIKSNQCIGSLNLCGKSQNIDQCNIESLKLFNHDLMFRDQDGEQQDQFRAVMVDVRQGCSENIGEHAANDVHPQNSADKDTKGTQNSDSNQNLVSNKVVFIEKHEQIKRVTLKLQNFRMIGISSKRRPNGPSLRQTAKSCNQKPKFTMLPPSQQGIFYSKVINQEITCQTNLDQKQKGDDQKRIKMLRKVPVFLQ